MLHSPAHPDFLDDRDQIAGGGTPTATPLPHARYGEETQQAIE
jgi:hypothetical protein